MQRAFLVFFMLPFVFLSCLSTTTLELIEPPYKVDAEAARVESDPDEIASVYFVKQGEIIIDGDSAEWNDFKGVFTHSLVFGLVFDKKDADGYFVLATDGKWLYILADVSDDKPVDNSLKGALAWRGDSVEIYIGTTLSKHTSYDEHDTQMRLSVRDFSDPGSVEFVVRDQYAPGETEAVAVKTDKGYRIEARVSLAALNIDSLRVGQRLRCEFQVNDADERERDRLIHWKSPKDNPYYDPSVWGDAIVVDATGGEE